MSAGVRDYRVGPGHQKPSARHCASEFRFIICDVLISEELMSLVFIFESHYLKKKKSHLSACPFIMVTYMYMYGTCRFSYQCYISGCATRVKDGMLNLA